MALFVLTVTVSLALLTAPPADGVTAILTVVEVLILITSAIVALIVVEPVLVAAPATSGAANTRAKELTPTPTLLHIVLAFTSPTPPVFYDCIS